MIDPGMVWQEALALIRAALLMGAAFMTVCTFITWRYVDFDAQRNMILAVIGLSVFALALR